MLDLRDFLLLAGAAAVGVLLVLTLRWRRRSYVVNTRQLAEDHVCPHLRPAYDLLDSRGHVPLWVGQNRRELPVEIHLAPPPGSPPFDPAGVYAELQLVPPVFVSERNVLYCKEHWCEVHPKSA